MSRIIVPASVLEKQEADRKEERRKLWRTEVKEFGCGRTSELIAFLKRLDEVDGILVAVLSAMGYRIGGSNYVILYRAKETVDVEVYT